MKILVDECVPKALKRFLEANGHECQTVQEAGWGGKSNGELLNLAEQKFEVFVTLDTNLPYQQNLKGRRIGILVLVSPSNQITEITSLFPACLEALRDVMPGNIVRVVLT
jgi:predicted nuclease of predicted toxin-antitoxin system